MLLKYNYIRKKMAIIYGVSPSPYVRKVMLAHAYKNIPYELKMTKPGSEDPSFRAASPLGKIPGYCADDGTAFPDSSVIVAYLERISTDITLYPDSASDFAMALWYEEYCDTKMIEATGALYFQRVVGPKFFNHLTDEVRVTEVLEKLIPPVLDFIESKLTAGQWLVADKFSIADIGIGINLFNLLHAGYELNANVWPKLSAFNERFLALDIAKAQLAHEKASMA